MKILNIYAQEMPHSTAKIVGNLMGLLSLRSAIDKAINEGDAMSQDGEDSLYASDGEGYQVIVELHNDKWGIESNKTSYWNKKCSYPEYIDKRGEVIWSKKEGYCTAPINDICRASGADICKGQTPIGTKCPLWKSTKNNYKGDGASCDWGEDD